MYKRQLLQMEVGAMMVGKIVNENAGAARRVQRGEEKGYFAFGGSTVIVLAQKEMCIRDRNPVVRGRDPARCDVCG